MLPLQWHPYARPFSVGSITTAVAVLKFSKRASTPFSGSQLVLWLQLAGLRFGLSTLASAGLGNTFADVIGVSAASGIEVSGGALAPSTGGAGVC